MQPRDVLIFEAYSDAKNSLVGVLDSPESLSMIAAFYPKILHYFIIKFLIEQDEKNNESIKVNVKSEDLSNSISIFNREVEKSKSDLPPLISSPNRSISSLEQPKIEPSEKFSQNNAHKKSQDSADVEMNSILSLDRKNKAKSAISKRNITLMENKAFKKDDEEEEEEHKGKQIIQGDTEFDEWSDNVSIDSSKGKKIFNVANSKVSKSSQEMIKDPFDFDLNEILSSIEDSDSKQIKKSSNSKPNDLLIESNKNANPSKEKRSNNNNIRDFNKKNDFGNLNKSDQKDFLNMSRLEKNNSPLSLPIEWTSFLNDNLNFSSSNDNKTLKSSIMAKTWLENILNLNNLVGNKANSTHLDRESTLNDYEINLWAAHYKFLLKLSHTLGLTENLTSNYNPQSIHKFFKGDLPWSPLNEKLTQEHPNLYNLMLKSFR